MIKSSKQYEVTRRRLAEFEAALAEFDLATVPPNVSASAHRAAYDALVSLRDELAGQLSAYNRLKTEGTKAIHFSRLADLPRVLIQTRIARNMTQTALADALEVPPQQVQRWEADDYEKAGLAYVLEIGEVLNVDEVIARKQQPTPNVVQSPNTWNLMPAFADLQDPRSPNAAAQDIIDLWRSVRGGQSSAAPASHVWRGWLAVDANQGTVNSYPVNPRREPEAIREARQPTRSKPVIQGQSLPYQPSLAEACA